MFQLGGVAGVEEEYFFGGDSVDFVGSVNELHAVFGHHGLDVGGVAVGVGKAAEACAGEEVIARAGGLDVDVVVHLAAGDVGVEGAGGGVVGGDGGYDADAVAHVLELAGD